jgi:hypothetical protein
MVQSAAAKPDRKHLNRRRAVSWPVDRGAGAHRLPGHGNGVRVHAIYFAAVSLVGLLTVLAAVALASTR